MFSVLLKFVNWWLFRCVYQTSCHLREYLQQIFNFQYSYVLVAEISHEISVTNHNKILEFHRFYCKHSENMSSLVLVTSLRTNLFPEIKIWSSFHTIHQFVDKSHQNNKCYKFNYPSGKYNFDQICVTCSIIHIWGYVLLRLHV